MVLASPAISPRQAGIRLPADVEASFMKALQSNDPLSDVDVALFTRKIFSKAADKLSSLDEDIRRLQVSLDGLVKRKGRLQKTLHQWHAVVSPMRTIPNEILIEIFMHVCRGFDVWEKREGPRLLCRICTRWKDLLYGTPALWANFSLDAQCRILHRPLVPPTIKQAVSLSASVPLTFYFQAAQPWEEMSEAEVNDIRYQTAEILGLLIAQSSRWVDVTLALPRRVCSLLDGLCAHLPLLETLRLDVVYDFEEDEDEDEDHPPISGFQIAPHLTKVTLLHWMMEAVELPLHQLSHLELEWCLQDGPGVAFDRLHYLHECPNLVELRVTHEFPDEEEWPQLRALAPASPPIVNKTIRVLHASDDRFLRSISLPALKELYITPVNDMHCHMPCPSATVGGVLQLLRQSRCSLEILKLMDCTEFPDLRDLLSCASQLEHLELKYVSWQASADEVLIQLLSHLASTPTIVPKLRTLLIHIENPRIVGAIIRFVGPQFASFVSSRFMSTHLDRIEVLFELPVELSKPGPPIVDQQQVLDDLRRVKEQGLDISITSVGVFPLQGRVDYIARAPGHGSQQETRFVYI